MRTSRDPYYNFYHYNQRHTLYVLTELYKVYNLRCNSRFHPRISFGKFFGTYAEKKASITSMNLSQICYNYYVSNKLLFTSAQ